MVEVKVSLEEVVKKLDHRWHWFKEGVGGFSICLDDFKYVIEEDAPLEPLPQDVELRVSGCESGILVANYREERTNPPGPLCRLYDGIVKLVEETERGNAQLKGEMAERARSLLVDRFNSLYGPGQP